MEQSKICRVDPPWRETKSITRLTQGFFLVVFPLTLVNLFSETLSLNRKSLSLGKIHYIFMGKF